VDEHNLFEHIPMNILQFEPLNLEFI
jgi:hypothetical protein